MSAVSRSWQRWFCVWLKLFIWASIAGVYTVEAQTNDPVMGGYFANWSIYARDYEISDVPARQITHLLYAFATPDYNSGTDSGSVQHTDETADATNLPALRLLKEEWPHLKTIITIGGWNNSDDFSDIMASSNARSTFASSCIYVMTNYDFDGVEIDWEYPVQGGPAGLEHRTNDAENLVLFFQELREDLDLLEQQEGKDFLITVTAGAGYDTITNRYRLQAMCDYVDWINVMTFDYSGQWDTITGNHTPLWGHPDSHETNYYIDASIQTCYAEGVPASKIVISSPFYGRSYAGVTNTNNGLYQSHSGYGPSTWPSGTGIVDYVDCAANYVNTNGYTRYWDEGCAAVYLYNPSNRVFITYEDTQSVQRKTAYIEQEGLRGITTWSMDRDTRDYELQRAIYRSFVPLRVEGMERLTGSNDVGFSWTGVRGESYTVDTRTNLFVGDWSPCVTLTDTGGTPVAAWEGDGHEIHVVDTNSGAADSRFYRVNAQ